MIFSKNNFFKQKTNILLSKRYDIYHLLTMKGYNRKQTNIYLDAYDYFCEHPEQFDGATFVKDLNDIKGLDLDAMLHDHWYLSKNVASNFKTKLLADWAYAKGQENKGKGLYSAYSRFFGLVLLSPIIIIYSLIKRGKTKETQKEEFLKTYKILIK